MEAIVRPFLEEVGSLLSCPLQMPLVIESPSPPLVSVLLQSFLRSRPQELLPSVIVPLSAVLCPTAESLCLRLMHELASLSRASDAASTLFQQKLLSLEAHLPRPRSRIGAELPLILESFFAELVASTVTTRWHLIAVIENEPHRLLANVANGTASIGEQAETNELAIFHRLVTRHAHAHTSLVVLTDRPSLSRGIRPSTLVLLPSSFFDWKAMTRHYLAQFEPANEAYLSLATLWTDVAFYASKDPLELHLWMPVLFSIFMSFDESVRYQSIQQAMKRALDRLNDRSFDPFSLLPAANAAAGAAAGSNLPVLATLSGKDSLPRRAKILIVSAFLAGRNPLKTDSQFFAVEAGDGAKKRRTRRGKTTAAKSSAAAASSALVLAEEAEQDGQAFDLERLLAIYAALCSIHGFTSEGDRSDADMTCIATMLSHHLLMQVTNRDSLRLEECKLRSNVPGDLALSLAQNLEIDLSKFMV